MSAVPDRCDHCNASYRKFRSGLTFDVVRIELRSELHRTRVTRHTVLGRMHEHKIMRWGMEHGIGRCVPDPDAPSYVNTTIADQSIEDWFAEGTNVMPTPTEDTSFDTATMDAAPALAPTTRKPRNARAPRKASIVEAITDAITKVEAVADAIPAVPKTSKRKRASVTVEPIVVTKIAEVFAAALSAPALVVAAPALAPRLRRFWCACGKRASAPIGAATSACVHRAA